MGPRDPDLVVWVRGLVAFRARLLKRWKNQMFLNRRLQKHRKTNGFSNLGRKAMKNRSKTNAFLLLSDQGCSNTIKTNAFGTQGSKEIVKLMVLATLVGKQ